MTAENEHDSTRERILQAATEIFAKKGYADTTVREICKSADVNLALVNYHFGGKEKLYAEVVDRILSVGPGQLFGIVDTVHDEESWRKAVSTWIANSIAIVTTEEPPLSYITALAAQSMHAPESIRKTIESKYSAPLRKDLTRLIRMALPEGLSPREVALEASLWVASLEAICQAHTFMRNRWVDNFRDESVSRSAWIKAELGWMTRSLFSQLHFRRVVD